MKITSIRKIEHTSKRYDIQTATENFYANGVLVHNSMIEIYHNPFDKRWEIATRGTAHAESGQDFYPTFRQAVLEDGFGITEEQFQAFFDKNCSMAWTYVFEYCSLKNRIVTSYQDTQMVLVTTVHNGTGVEYQSTQEDIDLTWSQLSPNVRLIKSFDFNSHEVMMEALDNLEDLQEGFVCQDVNGLRIKLKNSLYLKIHKLRGDVGFTPKRIASLVAENEQDEVLAYFPEYSDMFQPYIDAFDKLVININNVWVNTHGIESQKDFALAIKDYDFKSILFTIRKTEQSFDEVWANMRDEYRAEMLIGSMA